MHWNIHTHTKKKSKVGLKLAVGEENMFSGQMFVYLLAICL